ncbi:hypothetical protein Tco_1056816 [Tanacetum coccineum]|uniref:Uncharacterized protein n=1 Tax=Tanacetum coccineum TaxID=301880 RepID=A0ABQ5H4C9_9ASTR
MKSVSLKQRLVGKKTLKANWMQKESVSKQGQKSAKGEPSVHKDPLFDELDDDEIDNMDTKDAQDVGRITNGVNEEKAGTEDVVSTKDVVSTDKEKVSTDRSKVSCNTPKLGRSGIRVRGVLLYGSTTQEIVSTDKEKDSTERTDEGTDDQTEGRRATQTIQTTQIPTSKCLEMMQINFSAEKKFKQLASDEEMARKLQEDWETEEEGKRLAEEEATNDALIRNYDDIKARIEAMKEMKEKGIGFFKNEKGVKEGGKEEEGTKIRNEIMEKKYVIARLDKVSSPDGDYLVLYRANGNFRAFNYLMTVECRYPLSKELLQRMLDLGLEVERESFVALDLIRFIKQQIDEE